MTFGILRANDRYDLDWSQLQQGYVPVDFFYDHRINTVGFVFKEADLEWFVKQYNRDPPDVEDACLKNYADELARKLRIGEYISVPREHHPDQYPIIQENYSRHAVYKRRNR